MGRRFGVHLYHTSVQRLTSPQKSSKEPKPRKPKQPSKELSKDDETIKRLKARPPPSSSYANS